jgi:hypothetical protein
MKHGPHAGQANHDWGFRHCFGLNFSAPLELVRCVGGFTAFPMVYGYDDVELVFRLRQAFGTPVFFRDRASVVHDHRYSARDIIDREFNLGRAAWMFAHSNPLFGVAIFGRDIRSRDEVEYSRAFVEREARSATRLCQSFYGLEDIPAAAVEGPHAAGLVNLLYEQHLLLKRHSWRRGLLAAAAVPVRLAA